MPLPGCTDEVTRLMWWHSASLDKTKESLHIVDAGLRYCVYCIQPTL